MDKELQAILNNHYILNDPTMAKWVDIFMDAHVRQERGRDAWKRAHGGRRAPAFPKELVKFLQLIDNEGQSTRRGNNS